MDTKRLGRFAVWSVVAFAIGSVAGAERAAATHGVPFFDDFSDMNVSDDMPVSWNPAVGVTLDASSGDLVMSATSGAGAFASGDIKVTGAHQYDDISARTQLRLLVGEPGGGRVEFKAVGLFKARGLRGYAGGIMPNGVIAIARGDGTGAFRVMASMGTVLDVFNTDIHLRFDVIGDTLSLWAWADGTPEPGAPQLTATDPSPITGLPGEESALSIISQGGFPSSTVFRFVDVAVPLEPALDIKPGSDTNPINPMSRGVIPVAILGSDSFDVADVDEATLAFGPVGAAPSHKVGSHLEDVDGDGLTDLVSHYQTQETGIALGDTEACLTGETFDGVPLGGCDDITIACGLGFELVLALPPLLWAFGRRRRSIP